MLDTTTKNKLIDKILSSKEFAHSKIYKSYLAYLIEASEKEKEIKETTIAIDVFGKDANFNPAEDTIVRTHTYSLRKKLESYYYTEGKDDKYRLRIPKGGHYEAVFVPVSFEHQISTKIKGAIIYNKLYLIILALFISSMIFWFQKNSAETQLARYKIIDKNDPIWQEYLQSELPILVILGDHFFFSDTSEDFQPMLAIRHPKINSLEDLEAIYPNRNLKPADEPYFPYHSIWSLPPILSMFFSTNQTPVLRKSSSISPQILDEYNIIFLGSIKTLYILKHTLAKSHFTYEISPHKIRYSLAQSDSFQVFKTSLHSTGPNEDLVLALKLPGPANNPIFIIASYHSLGAPEVARYLTEAVTRTQLEKTMIERYKTVPKFFEILFRVTGIDKTAYKTEILIFNEITAE